MAERILFPEFRDELEHTRYPFADSASLATIDRAHTIELDTFLDASLYPIGAIDRVYISRITVASRRVVITIGDRVTAVLASASFDPLASPELLRFTDAYGRPAGLVVSDPLRLSRFGAWAPGVHQFDRGATEFVASAVIPTPEPGVRGLLTADDELFASDVWLVGDSGVVVSDDEGDIRVDIVGDSLFVRRQCLPAALFTPPRFLLTINGCPPDAFGNFSLTVGDHLAEETVVRIRQSATGLIIEAAGRGS